MTVIRPNSISGVTSITALANEINVFKHDGVLAGLQLNGVNHHTSSGVSTFHTLNVLGNISVGGTLTYQDVTNVDSLGIGTFRTGINVSGGQLDVGSNIKLGNAGVGTFSSINSSTSPNFIIKDGTTEKGYIGFNGNDPFIGRKNGVGVAFQNNKIRPVDGDDGSGSNNTVDIGENTYKFKDAYFSGTVTANSYAGDGSNLTGITGTTINNNADNKIITGSGSANTLEAESTLTYDGTYLDIGGGVTRFTKQGSYNSLEIGYGQNSNQNAFIDLIGDTTYTDYGLRIIRGNNGANSQADILHRGTGSLNLQTSDAASIVFKTNGNNERVRIQDGGLKMNGGSYIVECSEGGGGTTNNNTKIMEQRRWMWYGTSSSTHTVARVAKASSGQPGDGDSKLAAWIVTYTARSMYGFNSDGGYSVMKMRTGRFDYDDNTVRFSTEQDTLGTGSGSQNPTIVFTDEGSGVVRISITNPSSTHSFGEINLMTYDCRITLPSG